MLHLIDMGNLTIWKFEMTLNVFLTLQNNPIHLNFWTEATLTKWEKRKKKNQSR